MPQSPPTYRLKGFNSYSIPSPPLKVKAKKVKLKTVKLKKSDVKKEKVATHQDIKTEPPNIYKKSYKRPLLRDQHINPRRPRPRTRLFSKVSENVLTDDEGGEEGEEAKERGSDDSLFGDLDSDDLLENVLALFGTNTENSEE